MKAYLQLLAITLILVTTASCSESEINDSIHASNQANFLRPSEDTFQFAAENSTTILSQK